MTERDGDGVRRVQARFARKLRRQLERRKWTHARLAEAAGLERSQVTNLVNGNLKVGLYTLVKVAKAFGVDPGELIAQD